MGTHITLIEANKAPRRLSQLNRTVEHGETVEVDSELADQLLAQTDVWARAKTKVAKAAESEGDDA
jgi:hypothetical protein